MSKKNSLPFEKKQTELEDNQNKLGDIDLNADELTRQNQEYLAGWQRAKADYLNLKKETDEIIGKLRQVVRAELLVEFLTYWQNLTTAISHIPKDLTANDWAQGFIHSQRQIEDWLKNNGVKKMETIGEKFDYTKHEAVEIVWDEKIAPEEIVAEKSVGYEYEDQVLIHPRVVVNTQTADEKISINN